MDTEELNQDAFGDEREFYLYRLRHSSAHVLAQAVMELFPGARLGNGPPVTDGFYYDIQLDHSLTEDDLRHIEERMQEIVRRDLPIVRKELSRDEALRFFASRGQTFKVERIQLIPPEETISTYTQGDFVDLCRGPHVDRTGECKHLRLTTISGAYWLGDPSNPQLQRIYGTAWLNEAELRAYLDRLEKARLRDHRKLGKQLKLFMFHELAPGAVFWLPKGAILYNLLGQKMRELLVGEGYLEVKTPLLFDRSLWETSGHWEHFREDMFRLQLEKREFALKPMNCPSHMLIYGSQKRSYRELPLRLHDQGVLHRNELSGVLGGLTRVRQFSQDDAHIFIPETEIGAEIARVLGLVKRVYEKFGMPLEVNLSTRPESFMGEIETWNRAERALQDAIASHGFKCKIKVGEGTFYGPKIDFDATDALGRQFQCATVQLDFQLPRRFDLTYVAEDNRERVPVVIHRAIFGSFERFIGILIEHYGGAFPFWLAPVQCRILTISSGSNSYAEEVAEVLRARQLRVEVDPSSDTIGAKVRTTVMEKIPYAIVVGAREVEMRTVSLRPYGQKEQISLSLEDLIVRLTAENQFAF